MKSIRQAVILAGGIGKRLRPLTISLPKPMVLVNNRPFLEYLIELLKLNGIEEILLLVGYKYKKITDYFKDGSCFGVKIKYSIGTDLHCTGARLKRAEKLLDNYFLLLYCDNYWPLNLKSLINFYNKQKTLALVTVYNNKDLITKNNILVDKDGLIKNYDPQRKRNDLNGVEIGFFILNKKVLELISSKSRFEKEVFSPLVSKKQISGYFTDKRYYSIGDLDKLEKTREFFESKKTIFLDRDGVINKRKPKGEYVTKWNEFEFIPGSLEALKFLSRRNYDIFIITNQAGIGRGIVKKEEVEKIHKNLIRELRMRGIFIKRIYYCPHTKKEHCTCRKPKPGMLFKAASDYHIDLTKTVFIGDDKRDLLAGEAVGARTIAINSGLGLLSAVRSLI